MNNEKCRQWRGKGEETIEDDEVLRDAVFRDVTLF